MLMVGLHIPNTPPHSKKKVLTSSCSRVGLNLPRLLLIISSNILYVWLNLFRRAPDIWPHQLVGRFSPDSVVVRVKLPQRLYFLGVRVQHSPTSSSVRSQLHFCSIQKTIKACSSYTSAKGCRRSTGPCSSARDPPLLMGQHR